MPILTMPATERRVSQSIPTKQQKHYFSTQLHVAGLTEIIAKRGADGGATENSYNAFRIRSKH